MLKRLIVPVGDHALRITLRRVPVTEPRSGVRLGIALRLFAAISIVVIWFGWFIPTELVQTHRRQSGTALQQPRTSNTPTDPDSKPPHWIVWLPNVLLVVIGGAASAAALMTLTAISAQVREARKSSRAELQAARAAKANADAAKASAEAVLLAERAYVDVSHAAPGLTIGDDIQVRFVIKNHGRTPANICPLHAFPALGEPNATLPDSPMYGTPATEQPHVFLMPSDTTLVFVAFPAFPPDVMSQIATGERILWLLAYQDYVDRFGIRHRAGYCRRYIPTPLPGGSNNLVFVANPGYNYDIEIDEQGRPRHDPA
jgi:hypothetical protein